MFENNSHVHHNSEPRGLPTPVPTQGVVYSCPGAIYMLHVYCPGAGVDSPLGSLFFFLPKHNYSVNVLIFCKFHLSTFVAFIPFKCIGAQISPLRKIGQCHPRAIIYIYFEELESPMLNAKFHDHRTSGS